MKTIKILHFRIAHAAAHYWSFVIETQVLCVFQGCDDFLMCPNDLLPISCWLRLMPLLRAFKTAGSEQIGSIEDALLRNLRAVVDATGAFLVRSHLPEAFSAPSTSSIRGLCPIAVHFRKLVCIKHYVAILFHSLLHAHVKRLR